LPLARFQNLEFRVGYNLIADVQTHTARNVVYGAVRISFEPAGFGQMRRWQRRQSREKSPHTLFLLPIVRLLKLHSLEPNACQQCGTAAPASLCETPFGLGCSMGR